MINYMSDKYCKQSQKTTEKAENMVLMYITRIHNIFRNS